MPISFEPFLTPIGPGGGITTAMKGANALSQGMMDLRRKQLENQYYAPNIMSEINYRNAGTNKLNTMTPLEAKELQIKNQFGPAREQANISSTMAGTNKINTMLPYEAEEARVNNLTRARKNMADIRSVEDANQKSETMTPLEVEEQLIKNKNLPAMQKAEIAYKNAAGGRGGVQAYNDRGYADAVEKDNPNLGGDPEKLREARTVLADGGDALSTGEKLNPMSQDTRAALNRIQKSGTTAALMNQTAQLDDLVEQLRSTDITPALKFTGAKGAIKYKANQVKAAAGLPVSQDYLKYDALKSELIGNMDSMRFALKSSVQPKYVKEFIGQLTNPNSSIWNNPETVQAKYNATIDWADKHAKNIHTKVQKGVTAPLNSNKKSDPTEGKEPPPGSIWMQDSKGKKYPVATNLVQQALKGITPSGKKVEPLRMVE